MGPFSSRDMQRLVYFSEVGTMDRAAMLSALQACGLDTSKITDAIDDATLGELLKLAQQTKGAVATAAEPPVPPVGDPAAMPQPLAANAETCTPEEKAKAFAEAPAMTGDKDKDTAAMKTFAERVYGHARSVVNQAVAPLLHELGLVRGQLKQMADRDAAAKHAGDRVKIVSFCEQLCREGKITPFELADKDAAGKPKPSMVDTLLQMDDSQKVVTFGERRVSQRESMMSILESRPATRHGRPELLAQDMNTGNQANLTREQIRQNLSATDTGKRALKLHDEGKVKIAALA